MIHHKQRNIYKLAVIWLSVLLPTLWLLYQPGLMGPFTLDDSTVINATQISSINSQQVKQTLALHTSGVLGRPVSILTFIINYQLLGGSPYDYKVVNLGIHAINSILVGLLLLCIIYHLKKTDRLTLSKEACLMLASLTTLIWSIHPLQISTVHYIVQRMTLLSSLFTLLALLAYCLARTNYFKARGKFILLYFSFPIFLILALFSKENGALIITFVFILELSVYKKSKIDNKNGNLINFFLLIFIALPIVAAVTYFIINSDRLLSGYAIRDFTIEDRIRTEIVVVSYYLKLILVPDITSMSLFHDMFPRYRSLSVTVVACGFLLIGLLTIAILSLKRHPILSMSILWFFGAHTLESTIFPLELVFEHRNYLALLGPTFFVSYLSISLVFSPTKNRYTKSFTISIPVILLCSLGILTFNRSIEWSDPTILYSSAVKNRPESHRARDAHILNLIKTNKLQQAQALLDQTVHLFPEKIGLVIIQLILDCANGNIRDSNVSNAYSRLRHSTLHQDVSSATHLLMRLYDHKVCPELTLETVSSLLDAASSNKFLKMTAIFQIGIFTNSARAKVLSGDTYGAIDELYKAHLTMPESYGVLQPLIHLLIDTNQLDQAAKYLSKLDILNDKYFGAHEEILVHYSNSLANKLSVNSVEAEL